MTLTQVPSLSLFKVTASFICYLSLGACVSPATMWPVARLHPDAPPLVIAHRGASGVRPEHTLAAYELAFKQGADFIEPDLVATKDGVLIARHENELSDTTDVAQKFPARKTTKQIDGRAVEGYFAEDFTLAEIKGLRAKQRLTFRDTHFDGQFEIPTFQEVLELLRKVRSETGKDRGVYPELKHPTYFRSIKLPLEENIAAVLALNNLNEVDAPVFIQSFEPQSLKRLKRLTRNRLVLLMSDTGAPFDFIVTGDTRTYVELCKPENLREIASYANAIGVHKRLVRPQLKGSTKLDTPTELVKNAHAVGLLVHAWTFRNEERYLAEDYGGDPKKEVREFISLGLDGVFSDFPDTALAVRTKIFRK